MLRDRAGRRDDPTLSSSIFPSCFSRGSHPDPSDRRSGSGAPELDKPPTNPASTRRGAGSALVLTAVCSEDDVKRFSLTLFPGILLDMI